MPKRVGHTARMRRGQSIKRQREISIALSRIEPTPVRHTFSLRVDEKVLMHEYAVHFEQRKIFISAHAINAAHAKSSVFIN